MLLTTSAVRWSTLVKAAARGRGAMARAGAAHGTDGGGTNPGASGTGLEQTSSLVWGLGTKTPTLKVVDAAGKRPSAASMAMAPRSRPAGRRWATLVGSRLSALGQAKTAVAGWGGTAPTAARRVAPERSAIVLAVTPGRSAMAPAAGRASRGPASLRKGGTGPQREGLGQRRASKVEESRVRQQRRGKARPGGQGAAGQGGCEPGGCAIGEEDLAS